MAFLFWGSVLAILYTYLGYPLMLYLCQLVRPARRVRGMDQPDVDMIIPAHNEARVIAAKIRNTLALDYPPEKLHVVVVSDASTDQTDAIVREFDKDGIGFIRQTQRQGKAAALNRGLAQSGSDIVVFTDASILLARSALKHILGPFSDPRVGCVSGEDHIPDGGGEGVYGRYELFLRNLESRCSSIVGASGCFYAQRRDITIPFTAGRAPDFLSVLETVKKGSRAVTEPGAIGLMGKLGASKDEFKRKLRTIIRGITTLMDYKQLLNPMRFGFFAIELISHKLLRWSVGLFQVLALVANLFLLDQWFYVLTLLLQILFYGLAIAGWIKEKSSTSSGNALLRIPLFLCLSNAAAVIAWGKYLGGTRQEIWESSKR